MKLFSCSPSTVSRNSPKRYDPTDVPRFNREKYKEQREYSKVIVLQVYLNTTFYRVFGCLLVLHKIQWLLSLRRVISTIEHYKTRRSRIEFTMLISPKATQVSKTTIQRLLGTRS
jgi:hypothetical protein